LIALRSCVTERDVPVLTRLLSDRDHVTQLSAANVLADLGDEGTRALLQARAPPDIRTCSVIEDALREADSPTYRPIRDYSLTAQERSAFAAAGRPSSRSEPAHDQAAGADSRREAT
jgi:HEAT repeat protein